MIYLLIADSLFQLFDAREAVTREELRQALLDRMGQHGSSLMHDAYAEAAELLKRGPRHG
jgi:hypothetical protein